MKNFGIYTRIANSYQSSNSKFDLLGQMLSNAPNDSPTEKVQTSQTIKEVTPQVIQTEFDAKSNSYIPLYPEPK